MLLLDFSILSALPHFSLAMISSTQALLLSSPSNVLLNNTKVGSSEWEECGRKGKGKKEREKDGKEGRGKEEREEKEERDREGRKGGRKAVGKHLVIGIVSVHMHV